MAGDLKTNLANGRTWLRGLFILLFAILYGVAEVVIGVVVVLQFGSHLITGGPITRLLEFARGLNAYVYQILQFVTYRSEMRPFPFGPWPTQGMDDVTMAERAEAEKAEAERAEAARAEVAKAEAAKAEAARAEAERAEVAAQDVTSAAPEGGAAPSDGSKQKDAPQ